MFFTQNLQRFFFRQIRLTYLTGYSILTTWSGSSQSPIKRVVSGRPRLPQIWVQHSQKLGKQVVIVDLDPQGALSINFSQDPYTTKPSTYDALLNAGTPLEDIYKSIQDNFSIAPANAELVAAEYKLLKVSDRISRLKMAIEANKSQVDFILFDTPPSLGLLTVNSLVAANELLIPVATDYLAMRGVRALLESVWLIRERVNPTLKLLGLVPTLFKTGSSHSAQVISEIRKVFKSKVTRTLIPMEDAAAAAPAARMSVIDYSPESRVAEAYMKLAQEVVNVRHG